MGLDATLYAIDEELEPKNLSEDERDVFCIASWRKNYELNRWMYRLYQKKTGIYGDKYDVFDCEWLELTHNDLRKLKDDIICSRVRIKEWIQKDFAFVDTAMAKSRKGKRIYYLMNG